MNTDPPSYEDAMNVPTTMRECALAIHCRVADLVRRIKVLEEDQRRTKHRLEAENQLLRMDLKKLKEENEQLMSLALSCMKIAQLATEC